MAVIGFAGGHPTLLETAPGVPISEVVRATEANLAMAEKVPDMVL
jgi:acyl CoA:acetate/3-ketoacid CoA transferase beta subunit